MRATKIVFWQVCQSIHQAPYIRQLCAQVPDARVLCVFSEGVSEERARMGWHTPDYGAAELICESDVSRMQELYLKHKCDAVHIFSSINSDSRLRAVFLAATRSRPLAIGIFSEAYDRRGLKGLVRILRGLILDRAHLKKIDFALCVGPKAVDWYTDMGVASEKLFPFCYVVESSGPHNANEDVSLEGEFEITFVGVLVKRKNLLRSVWELSKLRHLDWRLTIIGEGPQGLLLQVFVRLLGLSRRIRIRGFVDNHTARQVIRSSDLLLLPSKWDGWGAVINEALSSGVPVLCSDYCGASDLIHNGFNGSVFRLDQAGSLLKRLDASIAGGKLTSDKREQIQEWSACIRGDAVAAYLLEILGHVERSGESQGPKAAWKRRPQTT